MLPAQGPRPMASPHMQGGMKPGMPPIRPPGPGAAPAMAGLNQQMGGMNLGMPPGPGQMKPPQGPVANGYPYTDLQNGPPPGPPSGPPGGPPGPPSGPPTRLQAGPPTRPPGPPGPPGSLGPPQPPPSSTPGVSHPNSSSPAVTSQPTQGQPPKLPELSPFMGGPPMQLGSPGQPGLPPSSMAGSPGQPGIPPPSMGGPPSQPGPPGPPGQPGLLPPSMGGPPGHSGPQNPLNQPGFPPSSMTGPPGQPGFPPSSMTGPPGQPGIPPPSMGGAPRQPGPPGPSGQPGLPPPSMVRPPGQPGLPPSSMAGPPGQPGLPPSSMAGPPGLPPSSMAGPPGQPAFPSSGARFPGQSNLPPMASSQPGPPPPSSQPGLPPSSMAGPPGHPPTSMAGPGQPGFAPSSMGGPLGYPQPPASGQSQPPRPGMPPGQGMSPRPGPGMMPPGPGMAAGQGVPPQSGMPPRPGMVPPGPGAPPGPNSQGNKPGMPPGQGGAPVNGMGGSMQNRYPGAGGMSGPAYSQGQSRRLNPDDMPSPLQVMEEDRQCRSGEFITNMKGQVPPLVTTEFTVRDGGNASPHHLRSTMYSVPHTPEMMKQTHVPFGLVISPMAEGSSQDSPLYVGTSLENGPVRCNRCKAYMSPLMQFMDGGRKYQCKLCRAVVEVPKEYFCHMDGQGSRADKFQRPELCCGSYEFIATAEYCRDKLLPKEPAFIFVIEMSQLMMQRGVIPLLCQNMKDILEQLPRDTTNGTPAPQSTMRVGFITYQSDVHFYKMDGQAPEMCVVCDREGMFVPVPSGVLCDPQEAAQNIEKLMESIPENFKGTRETSGALACAVRAGMEALKAAGRVGKLFVFHSSLPMAGNGCLKMREDRKLLGTEKEKSMLTPQTSFYNNLGQDLVASGCSVDMYLFNDTYVDLATIGQVPRLTGGQCYKYAYFQSNKDGPRLLQDLKLNVGREIAFDAIMRVRTSQGVRPVEFFGHFFMSNTTDVELASIDASKAIAIEVKHDDKLTEEDGVYIQAALLYTSCGGQRRLRIFNLALTICNQMADLFKNCELDTVMNFFGKQSVVRLLENSAKQVKENLVARTANILACYRKNCASPSSPGQLILPEAMKLLPLYINCLSKSDAISGGQDLTCDERSWQMYLLCTATVDSSMVYFYPRLLPLSDVDPQSTGLPAPLRTSYDKLHPEGVFLLENGLQMFIWVGSNTASSWLGDVFGVAAPHQLDPVMAELPERDNATSRRVRDIIATIRVQRKKHVRMFVVPQQGKHEMVMRNYLVEDKGLYGTPSYVDFLCHVHKEIRALLS